MVCTEITGHLLTNNDIGTKDKGHFSCLKIFQLNETMSSRIEDKLIRNEEVQNVKLMISKEKMVILVAQFLKGTQSLCPKIYWFYLF